MARESAVNAVVDAVVATLNVAAFRALCPGGVYRNRPSAQTAPFCSVRATEEKPYDTFGTNYGSLVTVDVRVVISGADAGGDSRAWTVTDAAQELLDDRAHIAPTGWTVDRVSWVSSRGEDVGFEDGAVGYSVVATYEIAVREA